MSAARIVRAHNAFRANMTVILSLSSRSLAQGSGTGRFVGLRLRSASSGCLAHALTLRSKFARHAARLGQCRGGVEAVGPRMPEVSKHVGTEPDAE